MSKHIRKNSSDMDPNMLLILLLILGAYSRKPLYFCDKELLNKKHNNVSGNFTSESSLNDFSSKSILKTDNDEFDVLNKEYDPPKQIGSDPILDFTSKQDFYLDNKSDLQRDTITEVDSYATVTASKNDRECGEVLETEVIPEYPNRLIKPNIDNNQLLVTLPVLLSQFEIEFSCESEIKLDFPAIEIKNIEKNIYVLQCSLLPLTDKLFISGVVRVYIEYLALNNEEDKVENNTRHIIVEVPFKCSTKIDYIASPVINIKKEQIHIEMMSTDEVNTDSFDSNNISSEAFNEKIYCKLVRSEINEFTTTQDEQFSNSNGEKIFQSLTGRMVIKLVLRLVQDQQISINKL